MTEPEEVKPRQRTRQGQKAERISLLLLPQLRAGRQGLASQIRLLFMGGVGVSSSPGKLALVGYQVFRSVGLTLEKRF
jgi:hypothetical protein